MISNQILQNTIDGVKGITKIDLSVVDADGNVLAETAGDSEDYCATVKTFADSPADSQAILGYQFFKVYDESQLEYIVVAKGEKGNIRIRFTPDERLLDQMKMKSRSKIKDE